MAFGTRTFEGGMEHSGSAASLSVSPGSAIPVDAEVLVNCTTLNADTTTGVTTRHLVTDSNGHTWEKVFERTVTDGVANDGSTTSLWRTKVTTQLETTDTITNTYQGGNLLTGRITVLEVLVGAGNTIDFETPAFTEFSDTAASRSAVLSGLTSRQYLFYGLLGARGADSTKTAIANYTEHVDESAGGGANPEISDHVATRVLTGTGDTWTSSALSIAITNGIQTLTGFYEVAAGGGAQSIDVVKASETETAKTVTVVSAITVTVTTANETETAKAVAVTSVISVSVGVATETETAKTVTADQGASPQTIAVGIATETETANTVAVVAGAVTVSVGVATETESAQTVTVIPGAVTVTVGVASETETAKVVQPVLQGGPQSIAVGTATELEAAQAITVLAVVSISVGRATETETAQGITAAPGAVLVAVGVATETETAGTVTVSQTALFFWRREPVAFSRTPVAFTRVGGEDMPPW